MIPSATANAAAAASAATATDKTAQPSLLARLRTLEAELDVPAVRVLFRGTVGIFLLACHRSISMRLLKAHPDRDHPGRGAPSCRTEWESAPCVRPPASPGSTD